jgi:prephenate dehydrogenase
VLKGPRDATMNHPMKTTAIGIIGFGRFGKVLYRLFEEGFDIRVSSSTYKNGDIEGVRFAPLEEVVEKSHALFLTVPINKTGVTAKRIRPFLKPGQLVVDVCSVKEWPYNALKSALRDTGVLIWPTHPMFGPDSAKDGFRGLTWVSCEEDIDADTVRPFTTYLREKGLVIVNTTCEEHDRMAARTQGLTHLIGRFLDEIGISPTPIDTLGYQRLMAVKEQTCHDTWELFCDLQHYNRFSSDIHQELQEAIFKVTARFLDTTTARETPVVGLALEEGSEAHHAVESRLLERLPREALDTARLDTAAALLDRLNRGELDLVVLPLCGTPSPRTDSLEAMGRYDFRVAKRLELDVEGARRCFAVVERRR